MTSSLNGPNKQFVGKALKAVQEPYRRITRSIQRVIYVGITQIIPVNNLCPDSKAFGWPACLHGKRSENSQL